MQESSEHITSSPILEPDLPDHNDGIELGFNATRPEAARSELISESTVQENTQSHHEIISEGESQVSTQKILGDGPMSRSPVQERRLPGSPKGKEFSVGVAIDGPSNECDRQATAPSSRSSSSHPLNTVPGKNPEEQATIPAFSYPSVTRYGWQDSNTTHSLYPDTSSIENHIRAWVEVQDAWSPSGPAQCTVLPHTRNEAASPTFSTISPKNTVIAPLPDLSCSNRIQGQHSPRKPIVVRIPPLGEFVEFVRFIATILPHPNETWRLGEQTVSAQRHLMVGPTQDLGPLMKPFDNPMCEQMAQTQFRGVRKQNDGIRNIQGL